MHRICTSVAACGQAILRGRHRYFGKGMLLESALEEATLPCRTVIYCDWIRFPGS